MGLNYNPNNPIWIDYYYIMLPNAFQGQAGEAMKNGGNRYPSDTDELAWDEALGLRPDNPGQGPATHMMIGTLATVESAADFDDFPAYMPGAKYWRESEGYTQESVLEDSKMQTIPTDPIV